MSTMEVVLLDSEGSGEVENEEIGMKLVRGTLDCTVAVLIGRNVRPSVRRKRIIRDAILSIERGLIVCALWMEHQ